MQYHVSEITYEDGAREYTICPDCISGISRPRIPIDISPFDGKLIYNQLFTYSPQEQELRRLKSQRDAIHRARKKVRALARCNRWQYFFTLTFNPEKVNSYSYDACCEAIRKWIDVQKNRNPDMKYILVFEPHKSGRYHVHGLVSDVNWRLKRANTKATATGRCIIYNLVDSEYGLGFSTVSRVLSSGASATYISKYIEKSMDIIPVGCKRYWASRNLNRYEDVVIRYLFDRVEDVYQFLNELVLMADSVKSYVIPGSHKKIYYVNFFGKGHCDG